MRYGRRAKRSLYVLRKEKFNDIISRECRICKLRIMMTKKEKILSPSRLKTLEVCSWDYWCNYHLKLPDKGNDGSKRGSCVHIVLECLLNKRHKKHYDEIVKLQSIKASKPVVKLLKKLAKKEKLDFENNAQMMDEMILVALNNDFFCEGGELFKSEFEFLIDNKKPKYKLKGIIDKMAKYPNNTLGIFDYKTSKKKFEGEEVYANIQAMAYSLYGKKIEGYDRVLGEFLFLRHPDDPKVETEYSNDELEGLEYYLESAYQKINNFTEEDAVQNMAASIGFPKPEKGFCGLIKCGRAKQKGQLKKNGDLMWHCPHKFAFDYYAIVDKDGEVKKTSFDKEDLFPKDGEEVVEKHYDGCPAFNKKAESSDESYFGF